MADTTTPKKKPGPAPGFKHTWGNKIGDAKRGSTLTQAHKKAIKRGMKALWVRRRKAKMKGAPKNVKR